MKILLSAYACEPGKGSEPGVGWNWAQSMAAHHQVWVLTRSSNRASIEAHKSTAAQNIHWVYFDWPKPLRFWKRGSRGLAFYYYLWQVGVYRVGRKLHQEHQFDLIHHVTFGNYWTPSFLSFLPCNFVLGPVGGGESAPAGLMASYSRRGQRHERLRDLIRWWAAHDPITTASLRRSRVVLATTRETAERLEQIRPGKILVHPQCGLTSAELSFFHKLPQHDAAPFRLISIARLVHWKGLHFALSAFARFSQDVPESEYWIIGVGPEENDLKQLACRLGIQQKVVFWGRLPTLNDVYQKLAQSDVLVHPAVHEAFGNVVLESLAAGRPVLCLNLGGPAQQVSPEVGIQVMASSPEGIVSELASAMAYLQRNTVARKQMGEAARQRARECFSWESKTRFMLTIYEQLMNSAPTTE